MTARTPEEVVAEALAGTYASVAHRNAYRSGADVAISALRGAGLLAEPVDGDAREALADLMIMSDALTSDVRAEALVSGSSQREPFLMFADAVIAGWRPHALVGDDAVKRAARAVYDLRFAGSDWVDRATSEKIARAALEAVRAD